MTDLIVVGTGSAGGVGKTSLVQLLAQMHHFGGSELAVLVADDKGRRADGGLDMAALLPSHKVAWLGAGPDPKEVEADPDALNRHWDQVDTLLKAQSIIIDLGANVLQRLAGYAVAIRAAKRWTAAGVRVQVWVPTNNVPANIAAAGEALELAAKAFGSVSLVAVKNEVRGALPADADAAFKSLGAKVVTLPKCPAPRDGMAAAEAAHLPFFKVADMDEDALAKALNVDSGVAVRTKYGVEEWLDEVYQNFTGLVPERQPGE